MMKNEQVKITTTKNGRLVLIDVCDPQFTPASEEQIERLLEHIDTMCAAYKNYTLGKTPATII